MTTKTTTESYKQLLIRKWAAEGEELLLDSDLNSLIEYAINEYINEHN